MPVDFMPEALVYDRHPFLTVERMAPGHYRATYLDAYVEDMEAGDDADAVACAAGVAHSYLCDDDECPRCLANLS